MYACLYVGGWSVETVGIDVSRDFPGRPGVLTRCSGVRPHGLCSIESLGLPDCLFELVVVPLLLLLRAVQRGTWPRRCRQITVVEVPAAAEDGVATSQAAKSSVVEIPAAVNAGAAEEAGLSGAAAAEAGAADENDAKAGAAEEDAKDEVSASSPRNPLATGSSRCSPRW